MVTQSLRAVLQLHPVPAGSRLDFTQTKGHYAYVYRRCHHQAWECVARNAHSPFIDRTGLLTDSAEYVVLYYDAAGKVTAATPIVHARRAASLLQRANPARL